MKKVAVSFMILFANLHILLPEITTTSELEDIMTIANDQLLDIDEWNVTIKEKVSIADAEKIIKVLNRSYEGNKEDGAKEIHYSFTNHYSNIQLFETYDVIIPNKAGREAEIIGVLKGDTWNHKIKEKYTQWHKSVKSSIFSKTSLSYTCLTTTFDGIINNDVLLHNIMEKLKIRPIQTQNDTVEESMIENIFYGYTPLWEQKIKMMDSPMNVQMAVTKNEVGNERIIIGTPILINEY